jgi:FMN phosphatase YigB (HAD superfamily)
LPVDPKKVRGIFFDLHDTLIDKGGAKALRQALQAAAAFLQEQGYTITFTQYERVWRNALAYSREVASEYREFSFDKWYRYLFQRRGLRYERTMAERLNKRFMEGFREYTTTMPGAKDMLDELKTRYYLGLVSNSLAENTMLDLHRYSRKNNFLILDG